MASLAVSTTNEGEAIRKDEDNKIEEEERLIGLIIPPPELKHIIETTAAFVAKNGKKFEEKIKTSKPDQKFDFLNIESPYHAYYINRIKNLIKVQTDTSAQEKTQTIADVDSQIANLDTDLKSEEKSQGQNAVKEIKPPPMPLTDMQFMIDPPTLKKDEINILKLTGIYAARFGRNFLIDIMEREYKNPIFDFLKPQHSYFAYFIKLVEQYTNILVPEESVILELDDELNYNSKIINKIHSLVSWKHFTDKKQSHADEINKKDRVAYSQIDWNDFTVVEAIDFNINEDGTFLPPCLPNQAGTRTVVQERILSEIPPSAAKENGSINENVYSSYNNSAHSSSVIPLSQLQSTNEKNIKNIEVEDIQEPQSSDQIINPYADATKIQEKDVSKSNTYVDVNNFTPEINSTIPPPLSSILQDKNNEFTVNARSQQTANQFNNSMGAPLSHSYNVPHLSMGNIATQIPQPFQQMYNNFPAPTVNPGNSFTNFTQNYQNIADGSSNLTISSNVASEPKLFKSDTETMSEAQFLSQYGEDPLPFYVSVPNVPNNSDWKLDGQTIEITFTLHDKISLLKKYIAEITKLPVSKQKIQYNVIIIDFYLLKYI
ncbi:MAG: splicing factor 3a, subunit 1, variant 2 [Marteilia pararefringens]